MGQALCHSMERILLGLELFGRCTARLTTGYHSRKLGGIIAEHGSGPIFHLSTLKLPVFP